MDIQLYQFAEKQSLSQRIEGLIKINQIYLKETGDHMFVSSIYPLDIPKRYKDLLDLKNMDNADFIKLLKPTENDLIRESRDEVRKVIFEYTMPHVRNEIWTHICKKYPRSEWGNQFPSKGVMEILFVDNIENLVSLD